MEGLLAVAAALIVVGVIFFVVKEGGDAVEQISDQFEADRSAESVESALQVRAISPPTDNWRMIGWTFASLGALGLAFSLFMKTSVETSGLYGATSEVVNLDLQFYKGLAVGGSLFAIGLGVFCLGVGAIVTALHSTR